MSKERLEGIKERANYHGHLNDDIVWLIQQAERVQELEELIAAYHTELSIKDNANKRIKKKNKRYKQALERILENWKTSNGVISGETIAFNSKEIARQALESESK